MKSANVVVFGGTAGINLGIAAAFARDGATVCVVSRSQDRVDAAIAELALNGLEITGVAADVRQPDQVEAAIDHASRHAPLDVVVAGAAGNFLADAADMSPNGFRTVVEIDLIGTFNVARASYPRLRRPGASLLAISAPQGAKPILQQAHACAAKAGVNMLVRCLALEWGPEGIRVNAISPGPIADTEGMRRLTPDDAAVTQLSESLPLRRYGTIDEIAAAALFLAGDGARYITGTVLDVDGGTMLGRGSLA